MCGFNSRYTFKSFDTESKYTMKNLFQHSRVRSHTNETPENTSHAVPCLEVGNTQ